MADLAPHPAVFCLLRALKTTGQAREKSPMAIRTVPVLFFTSAPLGLRSRRFMFINHKKKACIKITFVIRYTPFLMSPRQTMSITSCGLNLAFSPTIMQKYT